MGYWEDLTESFGWASEEIPTLQPEGKKIPVVEPNEVKRKPEELTPLGSPKSPMTPESQEGMQVDFNKLKEYEGFETTGYVPKSGGEVLGQSGVTVASGLDLGQHNAQSLRDMGIPEEIQQKLLPYLGKKRDEAVAFLEENPLVLTEEEANVINQTVKSHYAEGVRERFNKDTKGPKFEELPPEMQTALVSVNFQYGNKSYGYDWWTQMTQGRYRDAIQNLRTWGSYQNRRNDEADMMESALSRI